ncbi:MAG: hypothetical protein C5B49_14325 [Bdellovibrio sp.]|nr:MAG: hypothetical protein C5B49_14325 [Bdellovibrio sp.]
MKSASWFSRNLSLIILLTTALSIAGCSDDTVDGPEKEGKEGSKEAALRHLPDEPLTEAQAQLTEKPLESLSTIDRSVFIEPHLEAAEESKVLAKYNYLDPDHLVPTTLLKKAVTFFDTNKSYIANQNYLSVVDFSQRSSKDRFFIINMSTGKVWAIHVAHGTGSDPANNGYAVRFSNVPNSNASSLGYYLTAETYGGKYGTALRLDGLSNTNSMVRERGVVLHGAPYVREANVIEGRTWGCLGVTMDYKNQVINLLKHGSLIYAGLSK